MGDRSRESAPVVRKALIGDVPAIHKLVNRFASDRRMLSRSLSEIYESVRDYFVAEERGAVIGSAALHIFWEDLAEVRALAVIESRQKRGIGAALLEACRAEAENMGVKRVFALTFAPPFFEKAGFRRSPKSELPHKIWADCLRCPLFPDCDEEAVILDLGE